MIKGNYKICGAKLRAGCHIKISLRMMVYKRLITLESHVDPALTASFLIPLHLLAAELPARQAAAVMAPSGRTEEVFHFLFEG